MPLPFAHSLVGASIIALLLPKISLIRDWKLFLAALFFSLAPDFDFFFVWVLGMGEHWHRSFTHSILFAVSITVLLLVVKGFSHARTILALGAVLLSHSFLDFLTTAHGGGAQLLFPFSSVRFGAGFNRFFSSESEFVFSVLLKQSLIELLIFTPVFLMVLVVRRYLVKTDKR